MSKSTQHRREMLPLLAMRSRKEAVGSQFLIGGCTPGQGCSCGVGRHVTNAFEIHSEAAPLLIRTATLLHASARTAGFEFTVLELTAEGPAVPPKFRRNITFDAFVRLVARRHLPMGTTFVVAGAA